MQSPIPTMQSPRSIHRRPPVRSKTQERNDFFSIMPPNRDGMPPRIPAPSHRHAAPSGPWPFLDLDHTIDPSQLADAKPALPIQLCEHSDPANCNKCWSHYPQSHFPNWTTVQQKRSDILKLLSKRNICTIRYVDVDTKGEFASSGKREVSSSQTDTHWEFMMQPRPEGTRLRALFLENLSGPVLQMLGTKYNIEPFFFSSAIGWIPSRYQEEVRQGEGDHITISLTFIRTMQNPSTLTSSSLSSQTVRSMSQLQPREEDQVIDTQMPLYIRSRDRILLPDLLALHMVRSHNNSTIISYHPDHEHRSTTASSLHSRLHATGHSVYWSNMFSQHDDPTFVFLSILWYALYAWDETLEVLYNHLCWVESRVIQTNDMELTQELHVIQAHLLHYASLLEDFRKTVVFVLDTPYPGLDNPRYTPDYRDRSKAVIEKECNNLLSEIQRLEMARTMQGKRLRNVMNLGFSSVNIDDSSHMKRLTEASLKDSAAMKQIAYLSMFFLPATLVAGIFGMNVGEINPGTNGTIGHYLAVAIAFTVFTSWLIMAIEFNPDKHGFGSEHSIVLRTMARVGWPVLMARTFIISRRKETTDQGSFGIKSHYL